MSLQDKTVVQLEALARERGLKRYSKLKKADLIQLFNVPASLLDEDVPQIGLPDSVQPVKAPLPKVLSKPGMSNMRPIASILAAPQTILSNFEKIRKKKEKITIRS